MAEKIKSFIDDLIEKAEIGENTVIIPDFDDDMLDELVFG